MLADEFHTGWHKEVSNEVADYHDRGTRILLAGF